MAEEVKTPEELAVAAAAEAKAAAEAEAAIEAEAEKLAEAETAAAIEAEAAELAEAKRLAEVEAEGKPKGTFQDRINELTYKYRESERQLALANEVIEKGGKPAAKVLPEKQEFDTARPVATAYDTVEEYEDALFGWYDGKNSAKAAIREQNKRTQDALGEFNKNAAPMRKEHADFDSIINQPVFTDNMKAVIYTIPGGADVAYHLGANPKEADRIRVMPPAKQAYEISKLETRLLLVRKVKTKSGALKPLAPVGNAGYSSTKKPEDMPMKEYMEYEKKRAIAKLEKKLGMNKGE